MNIIIKASAPGEFTNVDFAVVNLDPQCMATLVADIEMVAKLKADDDQVYTLEKWDYSPEIYSYVEEVGEFLGDSDWRFVSDEKLKELLGGEAPQRLEAVRRAIGDAAVQWRGYLKHDDREWSTTQLTKEDLLTHFVKAA